MPRLSPVSPILFAWFSDSSHPDSMADTDMTGALYYGFTVMTHDSVFHTDRLGVTNLKKKSRDPIKKVMRQIDRK